MAIPLHTLISSIVGLQRSIAGGRSAAERARGVRQSPDEIERQMLERLEETKPSERKNPLAHMDPEQIRALAAMKAQELQRAATRDGLPPDSVLLPETVTRPKKSPSGVFSPELW